MVKEKKSLHSVNTLDYSKYNLRSLTFNVSNVFFLHHTIVYREIKQSKQANLNFSSLILAPFSLLMTLNLFLNEKAIF